MEPTQTNRPQIDGLRAFAVLGVLVHHLWFETELGHLGVRLFFVISGFLITGILLDVREKSGPGDLGHAFKTFYIRRALRIFPAYYAVLLAAFLLDIDDVRQTFGWHALYASNILFSIRNEWGGATAHLWSLSVEEQFYLVWPFVVLLVPRRMLLGAFVVAILSSLAFRALFIDVQPEGPAPWVLTPAALDALGVGGLLALWFRKTDLPSGRTFAWLLTPALVIALAFELMTQVGWAGAWIDYVLVELIWVAPMAVLVAGASTGFPSPFARVLEHPVALFLGRISYGIYLYHLFVVVVIREIAGRLGIYLEKGWVLFAIASPATVAVAAVSWFVLEKPLNGLKSRFPYRRAEVR